MLLRFCHLYWIQGFSSLNCFYLFHLLISLDSLENSLQDLFCSIYSLRGISFLFVCFIEAQLLYNVALASAVQGSESAVGTHRFPPSSISLPSHPHPTHPGHHRALSRAPCAVQYDPTGYVIYIYICQIFKNV